MNNHTLGILLGVLFVSSCASTSEPTSTEDSKEASSLTSVKEAAQRPRMELALSSRLSLPDITEEIPVSSSEKVYSFVAKNLPLKQALRIFAKAYGLNVIADSDVRGMLNLEFHNLPFAQAMEAMLDAEGLYWKRDKELITVKKRESKTFTIDYIRLTRSGSGSSQAQISSSISEGGSDSEGDSGFITVEQNDTVEFWKELEEQLENLVSTEGRLVVNRMSGTVQVSDLHSHVREVEQYIREINQAVSRQVDIDVKIVEVSLSDDFSLGVDWSRVSTSGSGNTDANLTMTNGISQPAGGFSALTPSLSLNIFGSKNDTLNFSAVINALKEQGEVRTVSQPKVRTLNNQTAMIKVGTDRTFFQRELVTNVTTAGSTSIATDVPQVVTEGVVLAITPQISNEGWIMMDVSPVITRVSSVSTITDSSGNIQSSAPNLDIRQATSLVRAFSGETVVIGGLIQDRTSNTDRSVPILGDIPLIGNLFRGTYKVKSKTELVMFITAKVVNEGIARSSALIEPEEQL